MQQTPSPCLNLALVKPTDTNHLSIVWRGIEVYSVSLWGEGLFHSGRKETVLLTVADASHSLLDACSDVDGEPVDLDDNICDQILSAAEALEYVELGDGAMPAGTSSYDVDMDTSTPDHMTSSSDPDVVQVGEVFYGYKLPTS